jgi:hypothetical protein
LRFGLSPCFAKDIQGIKTNPVLSTADLKFLQFIFGRPSRTASVSQRLVAQKDR